MRLLSHVVEVTRLLSNLIKYQFANFQEKDAYVIDKGESEDKDGAESRFVPIMGKESRVIIRPLEEVEREREEAKRREKRAQERKTEEKFVSGVPVVRVDEEIEEKKKKAQEEAERIIEEAKERAQKIVEEANEKVQQIRDAAHEEGIESGREEGLSLAQSEIMDIRAKLEEESRQLQQEYQTAVNEMEPRYVDVLCSLLYKLTGVLMDEKKDILLYLIQGAMSDMDSSERYLIRVSPEDAIRLEVHRKEMVKRLDGASIEIQEDKGLSKDECIIETDHQMVDCGIRTQLSNLTLTLRMLALGKDD